MGACPFEGMEVHALNVNGAKPSSIFRSLLLRRYPPAIFREIISIWIFSVYLVFCSWFNPHVFQEKNKGIIPSVANFYASTAPVWVVFKIFVVAAAFHAEPCPIFWAHTRARLMAVLHW